MMIIMIRIILALTVLSVALGIRVPSRFDFLGSRPDTHTHTHIHRDTHTTHARTHAHHFLWSRPHSCQYLLRWQVGIKTSLTDEHAHGNIHHLPKTEEEKKAYISVNNRLTMLQLVNSGFEDRQTNKESRQWRPTDKQRNRKQIDKQRNGKTDKQRNRKQANK